ncbi:MAG: hypothetical protein ABL904_08380 [Hyphomicrobiaceae bacterium]
MVLIDEAGGGWPFRQLAGIGATIRLWAIDKAVGNIAYPKKA